MLSVNLVLLLLLRWVCELVPLYLAGLAQLQTGFAYATATTTNSRSTITITTTTATTAATKQKYFLKFNTVKCDCCLHWLLLLLFLCVVVVLALCKIFISFILKWRRRRRFTLHNFGASRELTRFLCSDKNWWHSALKGGSSSFSRFCGLIWREKSLRH